MRREDFECIGVDVSKDTLDVALFRGKVDWNEGHVKVSNNESGYKELKKWLRSKQAEKQRMRVCMEYTGLYAHDFRTWLEKEDITYYMVDPKRMHNFAPPLSIKGIRQTKTDKADAFRIAIYCSLFHDSMEPSRLPSPAFFKLKRLLAERKQYQKQVVLYKQQLHDISVYDTVSSRMRKQEELTNLGRCVRQTEKEIGEIIESDAAIKKNYDLLLSVVGIGLVVAVTTIVLTENFTVFANPRKYASYMSREQASEGRQGFPSRVSDRQRQTCPYACLPPSGSTRTSRSTGSARRQRGSIRVWSSMPSNSSWYCACLQW